MRRFVCIFVGGALPWVAACTLTGRFECVESSQCTYRTKGVCEADSQCSYPDDRCSSGRRYGPFAGYRRNECVQGSSGAITTENSVGTQTSSSTLGSNESSDESSTQGGPQPSSCQGVTCSGAGTCVVVDDAATCVCEPGRYSVGTTCLEDPCDSAACYFVDATDGDDGNDGSRGAPWRSLARLEMGLAAAGPGDHFLLRRGRTWAGQLRPLNVQGEIDAPIVIGAYGPLGEAKPKLLPGGVRVSESAHLVIRDLWVEDDLAMTTPINRPCVLVETSAHVAIIGNTIRNCLSYGVRLQNRVSYGVVADNDVRTIGNSGISVGDAPWATPPTVVGLHHWIIGNTVVGADVHGIQLDLKDRTVDAKVMGNRVADVAKGGITVNAGGYAWVGANVVARVTGMTATGIKTNAGEAVRVTGNVVIESPNGLEVGLRAEVTSNTVVGSDSMVAVAVLRPDASTQTWRDNLILAPAGGVTVRDNRAEGARPGVDFDAHWYAADCMFQRSDAVNLGLAQWQAALMSDANSVCGEGSGVTHPTPGLDPDGWDAAFFEALVPASSWERCGAEAGAYGCDGAARGTTVEPIPGYFESDGFGWPGPLLVQQRYPQPR